jgi:hypothetical protein
MGTGGVIFKKRQETYRSDSSKSQILHDGMLKVT